MSKNEQRTLLVVDSSCTEEAKERTHDIIVDGRVISVTFKHGEDTVLPFEQGVKFMCDGFVVTECGGAELTLPAIATDNVSAQIGPDECLAKYTELTISALKLRAAQKEGGEIYLDADDEDKEDLIAFIMGESPVDEAEEAEEDKSLIDEDQIEIDMGEETDDTDSDPSPLEDAPENPDDQDGDGVDDELQARILTVLTFFGGTEFIPVDTEANGATIFEIKTFDPEDNIRGSLHDLEVMMGELKDHDGEDASVEPESEEPESDVEEDETTNPDAVEGEGPAVDLAE